jgi:hypothetical protein
MTPSQALRVLEIAAEHIRDGPQTGANVVEALQSLRGNVERWRLLYLWEYLQFDAKDEPHRLIGADQNTSAALRGIASELKLTLLDPVQLAKAIREAKTGL